MIRLVADNNVTGHLRILRRLIDAGGWRAAVQLPEVNLVTFTDLKLVPEASDRTVWTTCQTAQVVLITGNRAGGKDSLDQVIRELGTPTSLPVITISNPQRLISDSSYAEACALMLLSHLEQIETLRGVGRLFIP